MDEKVSDIGPDGNPTSTKFDEVKKKVKKKVKKVKGFVTKYKDVIILVSPVILKGCFSLIKAGVKRSTVKKQEELQNLYVYDRSLGHYWKLSRELTSHEWREIERRKGAGEKLGDILSSMNVLD